MSGDSRSRRRVAEQLDAFLTRSEDAIANLKAEVVYVTLLEVPSGVATPYGPPSAQRLRRVYAGRTCAPLAGQSSGGKSAFGGTRGTDRQDKIR
ncbi:hypothetical protein AXG93_1466s1000 [Marchantia polymorpha subsp. ruderalis]|uniref:Uncharacterized protein n=1 Tax=Marchantia polymorpha subsp. ruderalis TaxID=1480154 RepID=A0A176WGR2_MARPO|nr:hypothetical protein AXG93_1466s1000 [Marchantia polymorpha subsp. ruderalis]